MSDAAFSKPVEILLVEDNPGDVRLTQETMKEFKVLNNLSVVGDGVEAMAFLHREGKYATASRPDLILLDLNLPRKDGREVLAEIKHDEQLKRIPVVILTTSGAEQDILKTYDSTRTATSKSRSIWTSSARSIKSIEQFWFTIVKLPPE